MTLTPEQKYVSRMYEKCIDRDMDVESIRTYLLSRGLPRTPLQVRHDLDNVYCFGGYADSHPPAPALSLKQDDKAIDRHFNRYRGFR